MRSFRFSLATVAAAALLAACSADRASGPSADVIAAPSVPAFAKGNTDTDSRAKFTYYLTLSDGVTPTKIVGDGRLANGTPVANPSTDPSEYQGDVCGVQGKIYWYNASLSQSGDAVFDPDMNRSTCGVTRKLRFVLPSGTVTSGPFTNARQVMQLAPGEGRLQDMGYDVGGLAGCDRLRFDAAAGSQVLVTRLSGDAQGTPGSWTVESQGTHLAECLKYMAGSYNPTGATYYLPVRILITEIR